MADPEISRKLAVIVHADVVGSTALVQRDETLAHQRINEAFQRFSSIIQQYNGTVHEIRGDALVAEFARASDAVCAALCFQQSNTEYNAELGDDMAPAVRIGIALGEEVFADDTVTGAGVVLAQRVEQLSEAGGVCVTGAIHEAIPQRMPFDQENLGEQAVKGFDEPVRVYRVALKPGQVVPAAETSTQAQSPPQTRRLIVAFAAVVLVVVGSVAVWLKPWMPEEEPASVERMAFPLPEQPSIAVLPFDNLSADPAQEAIADGFTESLITTLAQMPELFVIARNSTFTYKGKPVKVKQVAEELGVRYVLEGSIQREGDTLRIAAQLIDAVKGHHLWADRYDRDANAMFAVQDEIVREIFTALQVKLVAGEHGRVWQQGTDNFEAYLTWLQGWKHFTRRTKDDNLLARRLILKAIDMDPDWAMPYTTVTWTHYRDIFRGWGDAPDESLRLAEEHAQKALALDDTYPGVYAALGGVHEVKGDLDQAIAYHEKAVALGPNISVYHAILAYNLNYAGRPDEAIALFKKAMRLEPTYQPWYLGSLGDAYTSAGKYEEAVEAYEQLLKRRPESASGHVGLIVNHMWLDRQNEARSYASKLLESKPKFTLSSYRKRRLRYKDAAYVERLLDALRRAGLPENPPLALPDKPSIAVLPFTNMSDDPKQEYFVDGMTEDLITDLSKLSGLFVIARNSSFAYKGKSPDVRQVSRELSVKYVLEGSVRRADNQVRINAQLIDATTGGHVWAERYDGSLANVFAMQDEVTQKIVTALAVNLTTEEKGAQARIETKNPKAYDAFLRGWQHYLRRTPDHYAKAREYFETAIELDPKYSRAYAALASVYWKSAVEGWDPAESIDRQTVKAQAREYLDAAMTNPTSLAHQVAAYMHLWRGRWAEAVVDGQRAVDRDPNDADSHVTLAEMLIYTGQPRRALDSIAKARRLDPHNQGYHAFLSGSAQFGLEQFDAAAASLERALELNPELWLQQRQVYGHQYCQPCLPLAAAYAYLGRKQDAQALVRRLREQWHNVNVRTTMAYWPFQHDADRDRLARGLLEAGLPIVASH
jgi:adenylate cyclase